jgi:hypothetical protein
MTMADPDPGNVPLAQRLTDLQPLLVHLENEFADWATNQPGCDNWAPDVAVRRFIEFSHEYLSTLNRPVRVDFAGATTNNFVLQLQDLTQCLLVPRPPEPEGFVDAGGAVRV